MVDFVKKVIDERPIAVLKDREEITLKRTHLQLDNVLICIVKPEYRDLVDEFYESSMSKTLSLPEDAFRDYSEGEYYR